MRVTASHRLELAGDWSDLPEYNLNGTGRVINVAVEIPGLILEARASITQTAGIEIISEDRGCSEQLLSLSNLQPTSPAGDPLFLSKSVLCSYLQLSAGRGFADTQHWVFGAGRGLRVVTNSTAPVGSGLGTSSILAAALFLALGHLAGSPLSEADACWRTYEMERACGLGSGWQDQIGGIIRGIKDITCTEGNRLTIRRVTAPQSLFDQLAKFTVLSFTNRTRFSGTILNEVDSLIRTDRKARGVIDSLKALCRPACRGSLLAATITWGAISD